MSATAPPAQAAVRIDRIKNDILTLARIGLNEPDHGVYRMAFTDADMEGKAWLLNRIEEAGLEPGSDGAANIFGRLPGEPDQRTLLVGSHIDTVPCAGTLDGTLGVIAGLETLRVIRELGLKLKHPIELVAFSDEEGRFGGMLGSQAFCGMVTPETVYEAADLNGVKLQAAMQEQGLDPLKLLDARRDPETIEAYLELHIEQGPVLYHGRKQVGIVDEITGLFKWLVRLKGDANHAGTTPMNMRHDAFMGLADFAHEVPRILEENGGERSRATIGKAEILPGSPNTVPGLVEFSLDVRDTNPEILEELKDACRRALSAISRRRSLMFEFEVQSEIEPVKCDTRLIDVLQEQAGSLRLDYERMPSGAAHDAQIMAQVCPVAMLFAPSKDGKSHSPAEWTAWSDIEAASNLLLNTLIKLAA